MTHTSTTVVLLVTGTLRMLIAAFGIFICSLGRPIVPKAARFAMSAFFLFGINSSVVVLVGLGWDALIPIASVSATLGLSAFLAVFIITAPPPSGRRRAKRD